MKIALTATTSWNLYNSRLILARDLKSAGHTVHFFAPEDEFTKYLIADGFKWHDFPIKPRGKSVFEEVKSLLFLINLYRSEKPDLVNNFTPKGVIYGSLAARIAGIKRIYNTITGLGFAFSTNAGTFLRNLLIFLYRISLKNTVILFQNRDNLDYFIKSGLSTHKNSILISGSGVDMDRFAPSPEPNKGKIIVILPSRFVEEKGIRYFVEAAKIIKSQNLPIRMVLIGKAEPDQPTSINQNEITTWVTEGIVEWWGWHNEMEKIYPLAHIVCLPTYYMEGIPKSLIEAAACGRPLIATNVPGCREIIHEGENGILVPVKNAKLLANAIIQLANDGDLRRRMGKQSRIIAETEYSAKIIVNEYFNAYNLV
ncbi:MAG: glycosyltransferase family 4 protein [Candidatus Methanofastidiosa archaeon]|nr:glycosyltransferase family 4 protein [Candidatus Methanofastidiosa archaeon]